jgi:hypothetical protein
MNIFCRQYQIHVFILYFQFRLSICLHPMTQVLALMKISHINFQA